MAIFFAVAEHSEAARSMLQEHLLPRLKGSYRGKQYPHDQSQEQMHYQMMFAACVAALGVASGKIYHAQSLLKGDGVSRVYFLLCLRGHSLQSGNLEMARDYMCQATQLSEELWKWWEERTTTPWRIDAITHVRGQVRMAEIRSERGAASIS
jgi:hypothetical protein